MGHSLGLRRGPAARSGRWRRRPRRRGCARRRASPGSSRRYFDSRSALHGRLPCLRRRACTQAGSRRSSPSTSTRHRRQAPTSVSPSRWHRVGMKIPFSRATSRMVWSSRAPTSVPSIVRVLTRRGRSCHHLAVSIAGRRPAGQTLVLDVGQVLVAEVAQGAEDRVRRAWPRPHRLVFFTMSHSSSSSARSSHGRPAPPVILSSRSYIWAVPDAARNALAAGFAPAEFHEVLGHVHHARRVVHHDHAARAHDGADLGQRLVVDGMSRNCSGMQPPEGPPVCTALNSRPSGMPPPMSKMISRRVDAHRHFDQAGVDDPARQREHLGALALLGADAANQSPPLRMIGGTLANVSTLLISVGRPHSPDCGRVRAAGAAACRACLRWTRSAPFPRRTRRRRRRAGSRRRKLNVGAEDLIARATPGARPGGWPSSGA